MLTERNPPMVSCAGAPALLRPWQPHPLCRDCLRHTHIGAGVMQPAIKRSGGMFVCANRVVA